MMNFFISLLGMSLQASVVIVVVLLLRLLFQKLHISKKYAMLLWVIPLICLIIPWKISLPVGFWSNAPSELEYESVIQNGELDLGAGFIGGADFVAGNDIVGENDLTAGNNTVGGNEVVEGTNNTIGDNTHGGGTSHATPLQTGLTVAAVVWAIVVLGLCAYSAITYGNLKRQLSEGYPIADRIYLVDNIPVPMVVGIILPRIYIPSDIEKSHLEYVIAHERTHILRKDMIVKLVAYVITCLHWFNPLVWLSYTLFVKDMEMACDEETILRLGVEKRKDYATALLQLATGRRNVFAVPLAFGEGSTKARIKNILSYKKTKQILAIAACCIGIVVAVVFLTKEGGNTDIGSVDSIEEDSDSKEGSDLEEERSESDTTEDQSEEDTSTEEGTEVHVPTVEITMEDLYNAVLTNNVSEIAYKDGLYVNKGIIEKRDGTQIIYYDFEIEYLGQQYMLQAQYNRGTDELCQVDIEDASGESVRLYPLLSNSNWYHLQQWTEYERRKFDFCSMLGMEETQYMTTYDKIVYEKVEYDELAAWIKYAFLPEEVDTQWLYKNYDGSSIQRIALESYNAGPNAREDIIFCRAQEGDSVEAVLEKMLSAMIDPLKEASSERTYRIIEYDLIEQPLIQITENVWLLEYVNGYYTYEGRDVDDMANRLEWQAELVREDGMLPFYMDGMIFNFSYCLIKEGNVYRLQKYIDMMNTAEKELDQTSLSEARLNWFATKFFNSQENRVPNQFLTCEYASPWEIDLLQVFYSGIGQPNQPQASQSEQALLEQQYDMEIFTDVSKVTREEMNRVLQQYLNLSLEETNQIGLEDMYYLEEYDAYYTHAGDTNWGLYDILAGWKNEDATLTLRYSPRYGFGDTEAVYEVTLQEEDGNYYFVSNIRVE